jgi:hypothetical protein
MYVNKEKFLTRDTAQFMSYLTDVTSGKKQISGTTLLPHLLVMQAVELALSQKETPTRYGFKKRKVHLIGDAMRDQQRKVAETQARIVDAQWATLLVAFARQASWTTPSQFATCPGRWESNVLTRKQGKMFLR